MRKFVRLFCALVVWLPLAATAQADTVDRSHPVLAATAFVKAFAAKDARTMAELSDPRAKRMFAEIAEKGADARGYREIFGGWRFEAAAAWDGNFGEMRSKTFQSGKTYIMLPYHFATEGWIGVLMLLEIDTGWIVDDIEKWDLGDYRREPLANL